MLITDKYVKIKKTIIKMRYYMENYNNFYDNVTCPVWKKCNGCQLHNMKYQEQLKWKYRRADELLYKYGDVEEIIGMTNPLNYRNKAQAAFGMTRDKRLISGMYQSSTKTIVRSDKCILEDKLSAKILVDIRNVIIDLGIVPYNEFNGQGLLRHILIKRGFKTNEIMVVFVGISPIFPQKKKFVDELLSIHPEITTIVFNINPDGPAMLLGEKEQVLYGKGYIEDILCGLKFRISAKSFYQVNPKQTEILYGKAMEFAGLTGEETVIDAYCGIGTIGLIASKNAKEVIGVESNKAAVRDAVTNAKINDIKNVRFVNDDAGRFMVKMAEEKLHCDVLLMDPPRAGSDKAFLSSAVTLSPDKIVYISCNPETLARDLDLLTKNGYRTEKIQPVDMFPFTSHIETVVLLTKLKNA